MSLSVVGWLLLLILGVGVLFYAAVLFVVTLIERAGTRAQERAIQRIVRGDDGEDGEW